MNEWLWENVFKRYQSYIKNLNEVDRQERQLNVAIWLRGVSARPPGRGELILACLLDFWASSNTSARFRSEIIATSRFVVDSINDDDASRFLDFSNRYQNEQNGYSWETQRLRRFQFAAQLIPESRVSELEREKITLLLSELSKSPSFDWIGARKLLITQIRWRPSPDGVADLPPPFVEQFLNDGQFANGETALLLALDANPTDEETRLGLGVLQFARALENLGKALYEYGAVSEKSRMPFLRLPVPRNPTPSAISYKVFGRLLDVFAEDLSRAEATLALIRDDNVKLRLRLAKITFDFAGTGKDRTTLLDILSKLNGGRFLFEITNPEFRMHFDRGDVAWLRAYCHLLCAMVDSYRSVDLEAEFGRRVASVFTRVESLPSLPSPIDSEEFDAYQGVKIVDAPRLHRMRMHLLAVCKLNPETWIHIRRETDDDYEWLPNSEQTDQLGLPLTDERIDRWLAMMEQLEGLLEGERLITDLNFVSAASAEKGLGLNLRKVLDDPPAGFSNTLNWIDEKYYEAAKDKKTFEVITVIGLIPLFQGPLGFAYAARLN